MQCGFVRNDESGLNSLAREPPRPPIHRFGRGRFSARSPESPRTEQPLTPSIHEHETRGQGARSESTKETHMLENYRSPWMTEDLEQFAATVRRFCKEYLEPNQMKFRAQHHCDREVWLKAGELGIILPDVPEEYGGSGGTAAHAAVVFREQGYVGDTSFGSGINHIVGHYLLNFGTEAQKHEWLPRIASGEVICSIAMTEPGTGSDLQAVRTRAEKKDGQFVINGAKTFITNGQLSDMVLVVAKTDPEAKGAKGISLIIVDTKTPGFRRGKCLDKVGQDGADTSEMFFDDCAVPVENVLGGKEGQGFFQLMGNLPYERAAIAIAAGATMEYALALTLDYVKDRRA